MCFREEMCGEQRRSRGKDKGKGKVDPITGHEGQKGELIYSTTLSLTSALDRGTGVPGPVWTYVENFASHRDSIPAPSRP